MLLKKLIVSGFKSFADKVSLHFDSGITGIVGPNGSGKSNVIDAVRWVMGEQNAKYLRGQVATDIIFAGSDKRKALAMAEVTLVFDNSDSSPFCPPEYRHEPEISLTRRLYIDGEREYFINKKPCRFKDMVAFFANTGLGGRSYSMIQQGQVDRILNAKPEDVREILEEAAGTLIFKTRRAEAQKKLDGTRENLLRIDDIVTEILKQLTSLESQVVKAKQWQEINENLKTKELALLTHNYQHFYTRLTELTKEMDEETNREVTAITDLAHLEARQEELQGELTAKDPELDGLREEISRIRERIARAESAITAAMQAETNGDRRMLEIDREVTEASENLLTVERQADGVMEQLSNARSEAEKLREMIETFQDEVDRVNEAAQVFDGRINDMDDEIRNLDKLLESNALRCEAIERDRKRALQEIVKFNERIQLLEQEVETVSSTAQRARAQVSDRQSGLDAKIIEKQNREQAVSERYERIKVLGSHRDKIKEEYLNAKARCQSFEELEASASDARSVLVKLQQEDETRSFVKGLLADSLSLRPEINELPKNTVAAFERWSERLVVPDLQALNAVVRVTQRHELGALHVVVLNQAQGIDQNAIASWAEAVDAVSLIQYVDVAASDEPVRQFLSRLYHLPVGELSAADVRNLPLGVIVVTASGLVFSAADEYEIPVKSGKGILSRKSEHEALQKRLKVVETDLAETQNELDILEGEQVQDRRIARELEETLSQQNRDTLGIMGELQSATQQLDHKKELLEEAKKQLVQAEALDQSFRDELTALGEHRISLGSERDVQVNERSSLELEAGNIADEREEVMRQHQSRKMDLAKAEAKQQALVDSHAQVRQQLERLQQTLSRRYEEKERIRQEVEQTKAKAQEARDEIDGLMHVREELEGSLAERREQNAGLVEELRVVERNLRDAREKQNEFTRSRSKKSLELERLKLGIQGVLDQSSEKYQIDITKVEFVAEPSFDPDAVGKEVSKLRHQLEGMGAINMMAVEEYEKLKQRHDFITAQREEVLGSIRLLEDAIGEIEETSKERFMATFLVINQNFQDLFPILFPGGEARLEISNEEDPLNAGVEIMVRLPGKKQQRMNLFSGGEKALTAISLIFALLKTKPTPFCFLDEVDAPLDEANVGRYNRVLEALSDRFQFIVITHNRRTMEVLDQLYGVTMEEGGVSKVVGVDMKKDLPAHLQKAFKDEKKEREIAGATMG